MNPILRYTSCGFPLFYRHANEESDFKRQLSEANTQLKSLLENEKDLQMCLTSQSSQVKILTDKKLNWESERFLLKSDLDRVRNALSKSNQDNEELTCERNNLINELETKKTTYMFDLSSQYHWDKERKTLEEDIQSHFSVNSERFLNPCSKNKNMQPV